MRPGAGYLPTLALGRSRGCTTEPASTDPGVATVVPATGALLVTLLRSAPRQAYRIYSEEEFLAAEDWQAEAEPVPGCEPEFALLGGAGQREPRRWGRLVAVAALASVVAAVVGVVALSATRSRPGNDRRFADGGITPAPSRARSPQGSAPVGIVAERSSVRSLYKRPRPRIRRASPVVRPVAARRPRPVGRPPITAHPYLPPQPPPPAETASVPTTAATTATPTTATPTTAATTATPTTATASTPVAATTATAATPAARGADAEFGFERR